MKVFSFIIFLFLCKNLIAQGNNNTYIYDSSLDIGHIKLMEYPNSKWFFHEYRQDIDSSENHKNDYLTTIKLKVVGALVNRMITITFDGPVNSCELKCANCVPAITTTANKDKTNYRFVINKPDAGEISIVISTREKMFAKINEVSKYIKP